MTKLSRIGIAVAVSALAMAPLGVWAANDYGSQPGYKVAQSHTICSGHGAFGAFGPGNNWAGGANGYLTGISNATLCGNRQGNLP